MGNMHDAWFFIGVLSFIFVIWITIGGPVRPLSFANPFIPAPDSLGGGTYLSFPRAPFSIGGSNISLPGSSNTNSESNDLLRGAFAERSVYKNFATIDHGIYGAGSAEPSREYVLLSIPDNAGVPIDITGWKLRSAATGKTSVIPQGTDMLRSGVVNAVKDIVLMPGDKAFIISGRSPIGGSFLENKCVGYFSTFQTFFPNLPQNCPVPERELSTFYATGYVGDIACVDYVDSLQRCQVALTPPSNVSGGCQNFIIKHLNYNGCVDAHESDPDFKGRTWRVYLGRTSSLWRDQREMVELLDVDGKVVDSFSY